MTHHVIYYWRVHKGFKSLAPKIKKKMPPRMISPYKFEKLFKNFQNQFFLGQIIKELYRNNR